MPIYVRIPLLQGCQISYNGSSIHARTSRSALSIFGDMFSLLMSYYQVPPSFLDFVFTFGEKINARDSHFSGLRDESRIDESTRGHGIPKMFRSGRELRLCYNLRSVEYSPTEADMRWSIRPCAVYQAFDLETGRLLCIHVKANMVVQDRIHSETRLRSQCGKRLLSTTFSVFLSTHMIMCDWSSENWRWYVNELEDRLHNVGRGAIAAPVDRLPTPVSPSDENKSPISSISRATTFMSFGSPRKQSGMFSPRSISRETTWGKNTQLPLPVQASKSHRVSLPDVTKGLKERLSTVYVFLKQIPIRKADRTCPPQTEQLAQTSSTTETIKQPPELPQNFHDTDTENPPESLNFSDLQRVQFVEEKAQDVILHLKLNLDTLEELRHYYKDIVAEEGFPEELKTCCKDDLVKFDKHLVRVIKEIRTLQSRIGNLMDLISNRKQLVCFPESIYTD